MSPLLRRLAAVAGRRPRPPARLYRRARRSSFGALLVAAALLGCAEGPQAAPTDRCDPFAPDCPGAQVCAVTDDGPRCRAPSQPGAGRACAAASCPGGEACATVEGILRCRPLCRLDGPCPDAPVCGYRLAGSDLGVCPGPCRPGDDCGPEATCGLSAAVPHAICVAVGPVAAGEACVDRRCAVGLGCLEVPEPGAPETFVERCVPLCDPAGNGAGCAVGACAGVILGVQGVGYCTDDS